MALSKKCWLQLVFLHTFLSDILFRIFSRQIRVQGEVSTKPPWTSIWRESGGEVHLSVSHSLRPLVHGGPKLSDWAFFCVQWYKTTFCQEKPMPFTHPPFFSFLSPMLTSLTSGCCLYRLMMLDSKYHPSVYWTNSLPETLKTELITSTSPLLSTKLSPSNHSLLSTFPSLHRWSTETRLHRYELSQHADKDLRGIRGISLQFCL